MQTRNPNLVNGRQLRAARALAGMTQDDLARAVGVDARSVRRWEARANKRPTGPPNNLRIEQVLLLKGVALTRIPAVGVHQIDL